MTEHERERLESLAALVGSGAATPQEQRELEAFLEAHPEAADEARAHADAGALLSDELPGVAPPASALAEIRAAIGEATEADESPQQAGAQIIAIAERRKKLYMATTLVAAAAAIAFAVLWNNALGRAAELQAMRARLGVAESPDLRLVSIGAEDTESHAKILIDPNGRRWLVVAHALPDLPADKDYQMWIIPKGEGAAPVPMGLLEPGPTGLLEVQLEVPADMEPAAAAISLENAGGVEAPTDIKMVGPI